LAAFLLRLGGAIEPFTGTVIDAPDEIPSRCGVGRGIFRCPRRISRRSLRRGTLPAPD